jgi:hypothetical protein
VPDQGDRTLIDATTERLTAFVSRKLDDLDGIEFAGHAMLIALGVTIDGTKAENAIVATALVQNLIDRGLRVEESMLFVIDGGKAIRKALRDVFGNRTIVERCQVQGLQRSPRVATGLTSQNRCGYDSATATAAKKKFRALPTLPSGYQAPRLQDRHRQIR